MGNADIIKNLLGSENTMAYSKILANAIGLKEAIVYSCLLSKSAEKDSKGYFCYTIKDLQIDTTLTKAQQDRVIQNLVNLGLILCERKGLPAKRYFKINEYALDTIKRGY